MQIIFARAGVGGGAQRMRTLRRRVWGSAGLFPHDTDLAACAVGCGEVGLGLLHYRHVDEDVFGHGADFWGIA